MSPPATWVRARDGALYMNPYIIRAEGFVFFDETSKPQLIYWIEHGGCDLRTDLHGSPMIDSLRDDIFGERSGLAEYSYGVTGVTFVGIGQVVIPGSDPEKREEAAIFDLDLSARLPRPTTHDGMARYGSRCGAGVIIEFPAGPRDAYLMDGDLTR
jgi:hypothetical protein